MKYHYYDYLDMLGDQAFNDLKAKLATLPDQTFILEDTITLYIDFCDDSGLATMQARTVKLIEGSVHIFVDGFDFSRLDTASGWDDLRPEECWCWGGATYAEWEGLFAIVDDILDCEVEFPRND